MSEVDEMSAILRGSVANHSAFPSSWIPAKVDRHAVRLGDSKRADSLDADAAAARDEQVATERQR